VGKDSSGKFFLKSKKEIPETIGRLSAFHGNAGILLRAFVYARLLGREGLVRASELAVLNANYLMIKLKELGYRLAFPKRRATHEFIISIQNGTALEIAKRLLDYGFHAPTMYFPILIPECLLIEPTETESRRELDCFIEAMKKILKEARETPEFLKGAPYSQSVKRLDEVKAAKDLDIAWSGERSS